MSDLRAKYEGYLERRIEGFDMGAPLSKEEVEFCKNVREYLAETKTGPEWGKDLK